MLYITIIYTNTNMYIFVFVSSASFLLYSNVSGKNEIESNKNII